MARTEKHQKTKDELDRVLAAGRLARALELALELERAEPEEGRWAQKTGDILRRQGRSADAADAFERAARAWARQGFLARAIAMAKTITTLDPARTGLLEELDPSAARREHRRLRPEASAVHEVPSSLAEAAPELEPAASAPEGEVRFEDGPALRSIMLDLSELELLAAEAEAAAAPPAPPVPVSTPPDELDLTEVEPLALDSRELHVLDQPEPSSILFVLDEPPEIDRLALLPGFPLFAELPQAALARLAEGAELVELEDGEHAVRRGEPADALYAVVSGALRVAVPGSPLLGEGDVFGESCLTRDARRTADVIAHGGAVALRFPKTLLEEIAPRVPALDRVLAELLGRRLLANALATAPMFAGASAAERREIGHLFELRRAPPRIPLLSRGKVGDAVYLVLAETIELEHPDGARRELGPGTLFGQRSSLARVPSEVTVRAPRGALVLRLPAARFEALARERAELARALAGLGDVSDVLEPAPESMS